MGLVIIVVVGFLLMWVFVVLPQRRRMAAHERMLDELRVGDEIITAGGLFGEVTEIGEDELAVEIAPGVEVRIASRAIASVVPPETYDDEAAEPGADDELEPARDEAEPAAEPGAAREPTAPERR